MIKKRDLHECHSLFQLLMDPAVFPYVRYPCRSYEQYLFVTKKLIVEEERKTCVSRTILDEMGRPIGTIELYNIVDRVGFLATWIGAPYFGKGYNQRAKDAFFTELFMEQEIDTVFLKIRKQNTRSRMAAQKLPYAVLANEINESLYKSINDGREIYDLYRVDRSDFLDNGNVIPQGVAT
ncbi:GNAT family N-acetyltransferase [Paenibacillus soyae]|uniref:GNAT family N-acetyltransferase n=1 Tax=Paenibacillus soyae TaxID=2969249 RepID=A0A9X2MRR4_9BACL|nr:GNAT family protein [Paenibacillus soyae]MCR2807088.1 GNAT family N-acetyltransferase [Paenibacillus soyae]